MNAMKVVLVGDRHVGKTNFANGLLKSKKVISIGNENAEVRQAKIKAHNQKYTLQLWESEIQDKYRAHPPKYYCDSVSIILVIDLSQPLPEIMQKQWKEELDEKTYPDQNIFLVGTNSDKPRKVSDEQARNYAKTINAEFIKVDTEVSISDEIFSKILSLPSSRNNHNN